MNPSDQLNKLFYNKYLSFIIPVVNPMITWLKQRKKVRTIYDKKLGRWISHERDLYLTIDTRPYWNISYKKLKTSVETICCKYYFPDKSDIIIDLGAGIGTESLVFCKELNSDGKVFAIEAHPETFTSLQLLKQKNKLDNLFIHNIAIADQTGRTFITNRGDHEVNYIQTNNSENDSIEIIKKSLDDFVDDIKIDMIDFLKVNIEGAEMEAIDGMKNSIKKIRNLAISCHDFLTGTNSKIIKEKITEKLLRNGFEIFNNSTGHPVQDSWIYGKNKTLV